MVDNDFRVLIIVKGDSLGTESTKIWIWSISVSNISMEKSYSFAISIIIFFKSTQKDPFRIFFLYFVENIMWYLMENLEWFSDLYFVIILKMYYFSYGNI